MKWCNRSFTKFIARLPLLDIVIWYILEDTNYTALLVYMGVYSQ